MPTTITVPVAIDDNLTEEWRAIRIAPLPDFCAACLEPATGIYESSHWVTLDGEKARVVIPIPLCAQDAKTAVWESPNELLAARATMVLGALVSLALAGYLFFDAFANTWFLRYTLSPLAGVGLAIGSFELASRVVQPRFVNPKTKLVRDSVRVGELNEAQRKVQLIISNDNYARKVSLAKPGKR